MDRILDNLYFMRDEQPTVQYGDEECKNVIALTADEAATEIKRLRIENGKQKAIINDLNGTIANDTCNMCNWLERGDCHEEKERLRTIIEQLEEYTVHSLRCNSTLYRDGKWGDCTCGLIELMENDNV
jgi:hypothetical protein